MILGTSNELDIRSFVSSLLRKRLESPIKMVTTWSQLDDTFIGRIKYPRVLYVIFQVVPRGKVKK